MVVSKCFNMGIFLFGKLMCLDFAFAFKEFREYGSRLQWTYL